HLAEYVLVGQEARGFAVRQQSPAVVLEPHETDLAPQRVPHHVAARAAEPTANALELALEPRIQADGDSALHVRQCSTRRARRPADAGFRVPTNSSACQDSRAAANEPGPLATS